MRAGGISQLIVGGAYPMCPRAAFNAWIGNRSIRGQITNYQFKFLSCAVYRYSKTDKSFAGAGLVRSIWTDRGYGAFDDPKRELHKDDSNQTKKYGPK